MFKLFKEKTIYKCQHFFSPFTVVILYALNVIIVCEWCDLLISVLLNKPVAGLTAVFSKLCKLLLSFDLPNVHQGSI